MDGIGKGSRTSLGREKRGGERNRSCRRMEGSEGRTATPSASFPGADPVRDEPTRPAPLRAGDSMRPVRLTPRLGVTPGRGAWSPRPRTAPAAGFSLWTRHSPLVYLSPSMRCAQRLRRHHRVITRIEKTFAEGPLLSVSETK